MVRRGRGKRSIGDLSAGWTSERRNSDWGRHVWMTECHLGEHSGAGVFDR
jgi:hypothetical protein